MQSGEIFIPKMNSIYIKDLIKIICPKNDFKIIGVRAGEKIHETLFSAEETKNLYEKIDGFAILPHNFVPNKTKGMKKVKNFNYSSDLKNNLNFNKIKNLID